MRRLGIWALAIVALALTHRSSVEGATSKVYIQAIPRNIMAIANPWADRNYCLERTAYAIENYLGGFLSKGKYTVGTPEEADYIFVDAKLYCMGHPGGPHGSPYVKKVTEWLVSTEDYKKRPKAHLIVFTYDHGFCGFGPGEPAWEPLKDSTIIHHWGLKKPERKDYWMKDYHHGVKLDCHVPDKDIVTPGWILPPWQTFPDDKERQQAMLTRERPNTLFFAGTSGTTKNARGDFEKGHHYSHGVRQGIFAMFRGREPGFVLHERASSAEFLKAKWCLAPSGGGYGNRLNYAMASLCVPVIVQDHVDVMFEDILEYDTFSMRLPQYLLYRIPQILRNKEKDEPHWLAGARARLLCAAPFVDWTRRAVEAFMASLDLRRGETASRDAIRNEIERCAQTVKRGEVHAREVPVPPAKPKATLPEATLPGGAAKAGRAGGGKRGGRAGRGGRKKGKMVPARGWGSLLAKGGNETVDA